MRGVIVKGFRIQILFLGTVFLGRGSVTEASRQLVVHPFLGTYQYIRLFNLSSGNQTVSVEARAVGGATLSSAAGVAGWGTATNCSSQFLCSFAAPNPRVIAPLSSDGMSVTLQDWSGVAAGVASTTMVWVITVSEDKGALVGQMCSQVHPIQTFVCSHINGGRPF